MLEKNNPENVRSYLEQTNETVQAKRGRNVEKYKTSYEDEMSFMNISMSIFIS